jgi:quercetin dioxygenase-like cupin family protein
MGVPVIHESRQDERDLPGRHLRWVVSPDSLQAQHCSACVIRIDPGERVRPAHSHPNGEEVIYIVTGSGRVLVDGQVAEIQAGSTVLFPRGQVHMVHNTGSVEMKVMCFFAPPTSLDNYQMHDEVDFPSVP